MNYTDFLPTIFQGKPNNQNILIWEIDRKTDIKHSSWFTDPQKASQHALRSNTDGKDIYYQTGTTSLNLGSNARAKIEQVEGISLLHIDLDILHPDKDVHKKENLPPTVEDAVNLIKEFPLNSSAIAFTGYGIHAYWFLQNFHLFDDGDDKIKYMQLLERFKILWRFRVQQKNWAFDATQDIARVLRMPGTKNWKLKTEGVQTEIIEASLARYSYDDFQDILQNNTVPQIEARPVIKNVIQLKPKVDSPNGFSGVNITVDPTADITGKQLEQLKATPKFKKTWTRERKDLHDQSPSSYDMALANTAVSLGWKDQEVCNLLIAWRNKHGEEIKRLDYFQRTINEARNTEAQLRQAIIPAEGEDNLEAVRNRLTNILGCRIEKIVKYRGKKPHHVIYFSNGVTQEVGDSYALIEQQPFRRELANAVTLSVPKMTQAIWGVVSKCLMALIETTEDEWLDPNQDILDLLREYVDSNIRSTDSKENWRARALAGEPAIIQGKICITISGFLRFAKQNGLNLPRIDMMQAFRMVSIKGKRVTLRGNDGKAVGFYAYFMPNDWVKDWMTEFTGTEVAGIEDFIED